MRTALFSLLKINFSNFPVGNKCGWLSSSQNLSLESDSGVTFSPGAIEINSFSYDVSTETVSFILNLYASRVFSPNSMFELLSISSEFVLSSFLSLLTLILKSIEFEMSEVRLL